MPGLRATLPVERGPAYSTTKMKPKLLLHICCGPCATIVVKRLLPDFDVVGFFHNPNIHPEEEYQRRLAEVQRLSALWRVPVDTGEYDHGRFLAAVTGLEEEPEGGLRCAACFRLRLEAAAAAARANGCAIVASTLTIGRNKRAAAVNRIGVETCGRTGAQTQAQALPEARLRFLEADWKKRDGFKHSVELAKGLGMYRQHYCGCEFSRR